LRQYADILCIEIVSRLDVFQFDDFLSLDAVQVASPELLRALNCVAREDMKGLRKLQADVPTLASVHGIDMKLLEEKMRLLSFASAASSKVSLVLVFRITIYIVLWQIVHRLCCPSTSALRTWISSWKMLRTG
jgi:hypothetical protein